MAEKNKKINRNIKFPEKREINLAIVGKQKMNIPAAVVGILLIVGAAGVFSKFGVADRFMQVHKIQREENDLRIQLDELKEQLELFDTVSEEYDHYTYTGMTASELSRSDRMEVVDLLNERVFPYVTVDSWSLKENVLFIPMNGESLEQINEIVQSLEADSRVEFCTVNTAVTEERVQVVLPDEEPLAESVRETGAFAQTTAETGTDPETEATAAESETEEASAIESETEAETEADIASETVTAESETEEETESEEETETETETETEPEPIYETILRVKGNVTCYLKTQDNEFIGLEVTEDESTEP